MVIFVTLALHEEKSILMLIVILLLPHCLYFYAIDLVGLGVIGSFWEVRVRNLKKIVVNRRSHKHAC